MTHENIEEWRKAMKDMEPEHVESVDILCDMAIDGLEAASLRERGNKLAERLEDTNIIISSMCDSAVDDSPVYKIEKDNKKAISNWQGDKV